MLIAKTFFVLLFLNYNVASKERNDVDPKVGNIIPKRNKYIANQPPSVDTYTEISDDQLTTTSIPKTTTTLSRSGKNLQRTRKHDSRHLHQKEATVSENKVSVKDEIASEKSLTNKDVLLKTSNSSQFTLKRTTNPRTEIVKETNSTATKDKEDDSLKKTSTPHTFPKRPAEFNPVIKKKRQRDPVVKIISEKNFVFAHSGNYHYSYEGGDGTKISSQGELKSLEDNKAGEAVVGSVFYKDKDGNDVSLSYTADENGYRPQGAHLPTPPPIPPAIARALRYLATKPTEEPVTEPFNVDN